MTFYPTTILHIQLETHDTKTYFFDARSLIPETEDFHLTPAFKAGSHIQIQLNIRGELVERTYTLSSSPWDRNVLSITVKKVPDGEVSNWLFDNLVAGDKIQVSQPGGDFVLPEQPDGRLLMLSAGSGVTPLMSMLHYLSETGNQSEIHFMHFARSPEDIIFEATLQKLNQSMPNLHLHLFVERAEEATWQDSIGRIDLEKLKTSISHLPAQSVYLCGPAPFMRAAKSALSAAKVLPHRVHTEIFSTKGMLPSEVFSVRLNFESSNVKLDTEQSRTLLEEAEAAGLKPESACRVGICKSCQCKKSSGTVINILSGEEYADDVTHILPCISVAKTDTSLAL